MINSFSVASSHSPTATGAGATAITLHFNYNKSNSNINNSNNNSGLKIVPAIKEHKSHKIIKNFATTTTTTTTKQPSANMYKVTKNDIESKHFIMTYPQQQPQSQQQKLQQNQGVAVKWMSPGKPSNVNTSGNTKEPQFIQVNIQSSNGNQSTRAIAKSALIEVLAMPHQQQQQQQQRTEDQENAFRQIEDVHNYAKLQHNQQHNQNSSSDELAEDDDDDDDDEEDDEADQEKRVVDITATNKNNIIAVPNFVNDEDSEEHLEVDVVTVTPTTNTTTATILNQQQEHEQLQAVDQDMRPEHHARRPMNAFLIFCKRHRAIVKERYKSLENRAITKILGDWWAALDDLEKQCFTDLAQQNKDAFFNANPNFKWYKLPAPPLRTLATRPSNAIAVQLNEEQNQQFPQQQQQQLQQQPQQLHWEPNEVAHMLRRNYFKFADETQMGELSVLLSTNAGNSQDKEYALQQALSETTQFLSVHMPGKNNVDNNNKRGLPTAADSGSNSSEEEERGSPSKKLKSSRSCKGKIYQELFNSGQLAAIAKKSKNRLNSGGSGGTLDANTPPISPIQASGAVAAATSTDCAQLEVEAPSAAIQHNLTQSAEFDLEEKIKELPALSLDAYLQRKRSTKKKKKFSSSKKQRNSNSASGGNSNIIVSSATSNVATANKSSYEPTPAVGSQKRKARKESITRRDVSAIEQEVASILPLTINGCYYFNQSQLNQGTHPGNASSPIATAATTTAASPLSSSSSTLSAYEQQPTYDVTSTSDLLILAEVAANRTELTQTD